MPSRLVLGVLLTVVSAFGFGAGALFAKPVYAAGVDWHTLMTWRFTLGAVLSWAWVVASPRGRGAVGSLDRRSGVGHGGRNSVGPTVAGAVMISATATAFWVSALVVGRPVLPGQIPPDAWGGIAGVGIVSTFIAIQAFYAGAHRIGAARASLVSTVEPVWTIALAGILFGERLTPLQLVGGALILAGVGIAQTGPARFRASKLRIADEKG